MKCPDCGKDMASVPPPYLKCREKWVCVCGRVDFLREPAALLLSRYAPNPSEAVGDELDRWGDLLGVKR